MPKGQRNGNPPPKSQLQLEMALLKNSLGIFERAIDNGLEETGVASVVTYLWQRYMPTTEDAS